MASSPKFWVDWSDPPFPRIRPYSTADEYTKGLTLGEAKKEIVDRARDERQHWLSVIHTTRAVTVAEVFRGEKPYDG